MNNGQTITTKSFEETQKVGFDFAKTLKGGDVLALHGDLGSGKTTFVQGLAKGLGLTKKIISPTFIIMRTYELGIMNHESIRQAQDKSRIKNFYHIDLYRIETEADIDGLGIKEIMEDPENIVVIEWPEKIENLLPKTKKDLFFTYVDDVERKIIIE